MSNRFANLPEVEGDGIDPAKWSDLVYSVADSLAEVVEPFLEDSPAQVQEILAAWERQDLDTLERVSHSLKSSAGVFGLRELMSLCYEIELAARNRTTDLEEKLARLRKVYPRSIWALKQRIGQLPTEKR